MMYTMVMGSNLNGQGIKRKTVYTGGVYSLSFNALVCKCTGQCTLKGSVQGWGVNTGGAKFF